MRFEVFVLVFFLAACGRTGDPLPPYIRIPEPVSDLSVTQRGYDLILTWTNPARNIDASAATDLERVHIFSEGADSAAVPVTGPGQGQALILPAKPFVGMTRTFAVQVETMGEKLSGISSSVSINPVDVPGQVVRIRPLVDQNRITLEWDRPSENPDLADMYVVGRTLESGATEAPAVVPGTRFEDERYEPGKRHTYTVTAVRRVNQAQVPGISSDAIEVVAIDKTAPHVPAGLQIVPVDTGAFVTWMVAPESDLAGYRVFRSESPDDGFAPLTNGLHFTPGFFDAGYRPGLYYAVSSVDESMNESPLSPAQRAP